MSSTLYLIILATMLTLSLTVLEAKSFKDRRRETLEFETISEDTEEDLNSSERARRHHASRRDDQANRRRRGFARWNIPQEDYDKFSMWRPSMYSLNRPYFIPIYGPAGQIPIYFPPQPFGHNVGVPPDNPLLPFAGPAYLPPVSSTTKPPPTTGMTIANRNPDLDDDDEPRPVWGNQRPVPTRRPPQNNQGGGFVPTRPPRPKTTTEVPPLVHNVNGGKIPLNVVDESKETEVAVENVFGPPAQAPPAAQTTRAPVRTTTPSRQSTQKEGPTAPSNCVWAVVSCCSVATNRVVEQCFEQRGCPGPFWDRSPCDSDFAKAAINKALEYYGK